MGRNLEGYVAIGVALIGLCIGFGLIYGPRLRRRRWVRPGLAVSAATIVFVTGSGVAYATSYTTGDWTWTETNGICVRGQTNINNNAGAFGVVGGMGSSTNTFTSDFWGSCETGTDNYAGTVRVGEDLMAWLPWNGTWQWGVCNWGQWVYNQGYQYGVGTSWWYNHYCGAAWYSDIGYSEGLLSVNGTPTWVGGGFWNYANGQILDVWDQPE